MCQPFFGKLFKLISAIYLVFLCSGCDDGKPSVIDTHQLLSPDGNWVATIENLDNGLGFGLGAIIEEVHITKPHEDVGKHGDPGSSVVYYTDTMNMTFEVEWIDTNKLKIICSPSCPPEGPSNKLKQLHSIHGIYVQYANKTK